MGSPTRNWTDCFDPTHICKKVIGFLYKCRTLTSSVKLRPCLIAIKDNAFSASSYPVVITFEDHITPHLQDKVAKVRLTHVTWNIG